MRDPLSSRMRTFLQRFFMTVMIEVLDPYWKAVMKMRVEESQFTQRSPLVDLFKPIQLLPEKKGKRGEEPEGKQLACIVPVEDVPHFWDCVLCFYPLFRPDLWPSEGDVARQIRE